MVHPFIIEIIANFENRYYREWSNLTIPKTSKTRTMDCEFTKTPYIVLLEPLGIIRVLHYSLSHWREMLWSQLTLVREELTWETKDKIENKK